MKKSKTTILEIADQAGVSPATVSRVLNHRSLVKADTISKVEEAMRTLGYSSGSGNTSGIDNVPVTAHGIAQAGISLSYGQA